MRKEPKVLEDHAEQAADLVDIAVGFLTSVQRVLADSDFARVERVESIQTAQQRRFAAAGWAEQGHRLAGVDGDADPVQHEALAEPFRDILDGDAD